MIYPELIANNIVGMQSITFPSSMFLKKWITYQDKITKKWIVTLIYGMYTLNNKPEIYYFESEKEAEEFRLIKVLES
jgi:hypothetical protein